MAYGKRILPETMRSLTAAGIGAAFAAIGTAFDNSIRILSIKNNTDGDVIFSFDGVNDHEILPASAALVYDLTANKVHDGGAFIARDTIMYAKDGPTAPTTGTVYVSVYYALGD